MKRNLLIAFFLLGFSFFSFSKTITLKYFQKDLRYEYRIQLLELALEKTEDLENKYILSPTQEILTQDRGLQELENGEIDVVFLPTSPEREEKFLPIKIPILRGILGYRVFLIHKDNEKSFEKIESFGELKSKFTAGFGAQWADMKILEKNDIKVIGAAKYESLFRMLEAKRFDYFPRGINEAWNEVEEKGKDYPDIMVDKNIALFYEYPVYFFVNKNNFKLAKNY